MRISHTEEVHIFREVTGVEQALGQQIVSTFKQAYLADIHNRMKKYITNTVSEILTHIQEN